MRAVALLAVTPLLMAFGASTHVAADVIGPVAGVTSSEHVRPVKTAELPATSLETAGQDDEPLSFGFIQQPPGKLYSLATHRLHMDCQGSGPVTILFEPGLGGSAFEWEPVRALLGSTAATCVYDRAGYAWSDPSPYRRDARQLAREADAMLSAAGITGRLLLVGHSFGGFIVRQLAALRPDAVVGIVLVDASHEDQFDRMESPGGRRALPRGTNFVISASEVPQNLPRAVRRKVAAFARMRKTYAATHAELASFRQSAMDLQGDHKPVDYPVHVVRRGLTPFPATKVGGMNTALWTELQEDLAGLSRRSKIIVASRSGHHVHIDEPELVADTIDDLIDDLSR